MPPPGAEEARSASEGQLFWTRPPGPLPPDIPQVIESARKLMAQGFRHIRVQVGIPGMAAYGAGRGEAQIEALHSGPVYEPAFCMRRALRLLEECRKQLGEEIELLHDLHEHISPTHALQFAEDCELFRLLSQQCATPIAMGELFNSPHEWTPLIAECQPLNGGWGEVRRRDGTFIKQ